jgi:hypothetical protein
MTLTKKHKHILIGYAAIAGLYYFQAQRKGLNPSFTTALEWPLNLLRAPSGTLAVLTGSATAAGNI